METSIWFEPNMAVVRPHTEQGQQTRHKYRATYNLQPIQATCRPQLSLRGFALEPNIYRAQGMERRAQHSGKGLRTKELGVGWSPTYFNSTRFILTVIIVISIAAILIIIITTFRVSKNLSHCRDHRPYMVHPICTYIWPTHQYI